MTTSSSPAITYIVPGFDVQAYAGEALASLQAQTRPDWTAILIDDGSTDATGDVFAAAAASDPRFRLARHDRQRGLGAARNTALDLVETPFVGFLDADDILVPTAAERMLGVLEATGSDFVVGAYVRLRPDESGGYTPGEVQPWVAAATAPERHRVTLAEHPDVTGSIVAWAKVSRTEFWRAHDLRFPERLYEDQVVAQRMYAAASAFDTVPDVAVQWRIRADGTSITQREADLAVLRDCLDAMSAGLDVLEGTGVEAAVQARLGLILRMDVPRLAQLAVAHSDDAYRSALGSFARRVWDRADAARATLGAPAFDAVTRELVESALGW